MIPVDFIAVPTAKATWLFNDQPIATSQVVAVSDSDTFTTLTVKNMAAENSGEYKVKVTNKAGSAVAKFTINVMGKTRHSVAKVTINVFGKTRHSVAKFTINVFGAGQFWLMLFALDELSGHDHCNWQNINCNILLMVLSNLKIIKSLYIYIIIRTVDSMRHYLTFL